MVNTNRIFWISGEVYVVSITIPREALAGGNTARVEQSNFDGGRFAGASFTWDIDIAVAEWSNIQYAVRNIDNSFINYGDEIVGVNVVFLNNAVGALNLGGRCQIFMKK